MKKTQPSVKRQAFEPLTNGTLIDYTALRVGDPAGDRFIVACEKCKKPGIAHGRKCLHIVRYAQTASGKAVQSVVKSCAGGAPREKPVERKNLGFPFCPKGPAVIRLGALGWSLHTHPAYRRAT